MAAPHMCQRPFCTEQAIDQCECCRAELWFCAGHGTVGGDRDGDDMCCAAPSACWECGGADYWHGMTDAAIRQFLAGWPTVQS